MRRDTRGPLRKRDLETLPRARDCCCESGCRRAQGQLERRSIYLGRTDRIRSPQRRPAEYPGASDRRTPALAARTARSLRYVCSAVPPQRSDLRAHGPERSLSVRKHFVKYWDVDITYESARTGLFDLTHSDERFVRRASTSVRRKGVGDCPVRESSSTRDPGVEGNGSKSRRVGRSRRSLRLRLRLLLSSATAPAPPHCACNEPPHACGALRPLSVQLGRKKAKR